MSEHMVAMHQKTRQPNSTVSSKTITERLTKPQLERWQGDEKSLFLKQFWYPTMWSSNFLWEYARRTVNVSAINWYAAITAVSSTPPNLAQQIPGTP